MLLFIGVLSLSISCNKKDYEYTVETTTVDGTDMYVKLNNELSYVGPVLSEYRFKASKGLRLTVKVFVSDTVQGGSYATQGSTIVLKRGKKVLTETSEDVLVW